MRTKHNTEITLENIRPGTVLVIHGKIGIVTQIRSGKYPIIYKNNTEHNGYKADLGSVDLILAHGDLEGFQEAVQEKEKESMKFADLYLPDELQGVQVGDQIRMGRDVVVFKGYKPSRPKYPISFERNGKQFKGTMSSFRGKVTS